MTVRTIRGRPIYPCAICAWVLNALVLVRAFDWGSIVGVTAEANLRSHAIGVACFMVFGEPVVRAIKVQASALFSMREEKKRV